MPTYTKRLQILLPPHVWDRLRVLARERHTSVAELIRDAVERVYFPDQSLAPLDAVRRLGAMNLPVADWEQMEAESVTGGCDEEGVH